MNLAPSSVLDPPSLQFPETSHNDHDSALNSGAEPIRASHLDIISTASIATAAWHAFLWLVIGNAIGVMLALLLLVPSLNAILGEWTYGRWMMVHVNILLYGWCSLPMLGWLFRTYGADRGPLAAWCRPVLWAWSTALFLGSLTWLAGHSSGKLFLDWFGYARFAFPVAMLALWLLLAGSLVLAWNSAPNRQWFARATKIIGLAILLAVPVAIYVASSPGLYPAINPSTGGPTGESQLESSLGVVAILLIVPFGVARRKPGRHRPLALSVIVFAAESLLCLSMSRGDVSHHLPSQYLSLGSLLIWLPLAPAYYATFQWHENARGWRMALLWWWGFLVVSGWIMFLPGVLEHFKFTDGLVGHSLVAVAGFLTALLAVVLVQLLGDDGWILTRHWSFHVWNWSVLAYVVLMLIAGSIEGSHPAFTIVPSPARNVLYILRLVTGIFMLVSSAEWLIAASALLRIRGFIPSERSHGVTA
jgi:cytochrome c oxidase cbb3-type subunit 1